MKQYAIGLYEKAMPSTLDWKQKLQTARECGYDYVEISIDETDDKLARLDWSREERIALKRICEETGIPLGSMCLSGHRKYPLGSADQEERSMEIMEKALQLASDLGIRVIQLAGYDVYYEESSQETKDRFMRNLKKSADLAAKYGVLLGFETMETPFMDTVWKSMFYVKHVNSPYLGVYPDTGNLTNASKVYKHNVLDDLASGWGHVVALHLKETIPGHYREIPFLTGHVDFESMISLAWKMGVRRYVTEMWYVGQHNWEEDIRFACTSMKRILDFVQEQ